MDSEASLNLITYTGSDKASSHCDSEVTPIRIDTSNRDLGSASYHSLATTDFNSLTTNNDFALGNILSYLVLKDVLATLIILRKEDPFFDPSKKLLVSILRCSLRFHVSERGLSIIAKHLKCLRAKYAASSSTGSSSHLRAAAGELFQLSSLQRLRTVFLQLTREVPPFFTELIVRNETTCIPCTHSVLTIANEFEITLPCTTCTSKCKRIVFEHCPVCLQPRKECEYHSTNCYDCNTLVRLGCILVTQPGEGGNNICRRCAYRCSTCTGIFISSTDGSQVQCNALIEGQPCPLIDEDICGDCAFEELEFSLCYKCDRCVCGECKAGVPYYFQACNECGEVLCNDCGEFERCTNCNIMCCRECNTRKNYFAICDGPSSDQPCPFGARFTCGTCALEQLGYSSCYDCGREACGECKAAAPESFYYCDGCSKELCIECRSFRKCFNCDVRFCRECDANNRIYLVSCDGMGKDRPCPAGAVELCYECAFAEIGYRRCDCCRRCACKNCCSNGDVDYDRPCHYRCVDAIGFHSWLMKILPTNLELELLTRMLKQQQKQKK